MKTKTILKALTLLFLAALCCVGVFTLADTLLDHKVAMWFEETFTYRYYYDRSGAWVPKLDWDKFKHTALIISIAGVGSIITAVAVTAVVTRKKARADALQDAEIFLREYLADRRQPEPQYQELADCTADFQAKLLHDEQVWKDETAKKNDLIAYLAHDLKTPLTSVIGYLSLLEEAPDMPAVQKAKYIHIALRKAQRLESLTNEFFEITRYNLHEIVLEKEPLDLSVMLMQMTDEFYPTLKAHGNTAELDTADTLTVQADPAKLARVFNNILKNAIAYSEPGTPIRITARQKEGTVEIAFSNLGKTIPPQKLQAIFDKFYRLDSARSTNSGGAGLGLAIAREIVRLHGGSIRAESEAGKTVFTVELPKSA